ncbi:hypothetical protein BO94DRAFT_132158 [Aspergillus sclerotioniger CBS 115572]|uniref:Uncharacterized protein n=1 Tax=Aspergillus sclerotioniger CBS 115572 TaxID=1450535 RepID=A0A317XFS8_9EURO|nr:hypothetical protein BO94DRAFT_132158 [Aspergillus sclerotioniger CBS 115572]PWY95640.1 hypothetical protein BO94DRAFT_132158 [Aspergillus sclerotioniger CBS 115572]
MKTQQQHSNFLLTPSWLSCYLTFNSLVILKLTTLSSSQVHCSPVVVRFMRWSIPSEISVLGIGLRSDARSVVIQAVVFGYGRGDGITIFTMSLFFE